MSRQPSSPAEIPSQTAAVASAAFPRGNAYLRLRDELGTVFTDAQFTALFSARGRRAEAPWRLALVAVLQFAESLSDRTANLAHQSRTVRAPRTGCSHLVGARNTLRWRPRESETPMRPSERYRWRTGIEGTLSPGVRALHLRRARYLGLAKVHLQHVLTAAALNIGRIADWLAGETVASTRRSHFARTISQAA